MPKSLGTEIETWLAKEGSNYSDENPRLRYSRVQNFGAWYRKCHRCYYQQTEVDGAFPETSHVCERDNSLMFIRWAIRPKTQGEFI